MTPRLVARRASRATGGDFEAVPAHRQIVAEACAPKCRSRRPSSPVHSRDSHPIIQYRVGSDQQGGGHQSGADRPLHPPQVAAERPELQNPGCRTHRSGRPKPWLGEGNAGEPDLAAGVTLDRHACSPSSGCSGRVPYASPNQSGPSTTRMIRQTASATPTRGDAGRATVRRSSTGIFRDDDARCSVGRPGGGSGPARTERVGAVPRRVSTSLLGTALAQFLLRLA